MIASGHFLTAAAIGAPVFGSGIMALMVLWFLLLIAFLILALICLASSVIFVVSMSLCVPKGKPAMDGERNPYRRQANRSGPSPTSVGYKITAGISGAVFVITLLGSLSCLFALLHLQPALSGGSALRPSASAPIPPLVAPEQLARHRFWKKAPTPAELKNMIAPFQQKGTRPSWLYVDDQGQTRIVAAGAVAPADLGVRNQWLPVTYQADDRRAYGLIKDRLDAFVSGEAVEHDAE